MAEYEASGPKFHVCVTQTRSGIADYAKDFHRLVLGPEGYALCDPGEIPRGGDLRKEMQFHVQLGAFQHAERRMVSHLLTAGCDAVEATIHDPPFATFPYFAFGSPFLTRLSRGFDWYLRSFGLQRRFLERLRRVFVLSDHGKAAVLRVAPRANVFVMPHIVDRERVWAPDSPLGVGLIYFGFIGPNKGLDHVLEVHAALRCLLPGVRLHVVGQPGNDRARSYLEDLQRRYTDDVIYHGYVTDSHLDELFTQAAHVLLPYAPYRYIVPTSGSVIHALRRARVIWTTPANAMSELIVDGENGFLLTMDPVADARRLARVIEDRLLARRISDGARETALAMADFPYRRFLGLGALPART